MMKKTHATIVERAGSPGVSACAGCWRTSRRRFFGQISAAALAAMVGDSRPARADTVPIRESAGTQAGPAEHAYPVPTADGVTIDRDTQVILVRFQQKVYAFNLACPHENTALRWRPQDTRFQCPRHESKYQPDGTFIEGRATRNMDRFSIRRQGPNVVVDLYKLYRSDQHKAEWAAAVITL